MSPEEKDLLLCWFEHIADMVNTIYVTGEDMDTHIPCVVSNRMQIVGIVSKTPIESRRNAPNLKSFES